jgi:hypothetical protein
MVSPTWHHLALPPCSTTTSSPPPPFTITSFGPHLALVSTFSWFFWAFPFPTFCYSDSSSLLVLHFTSLPPSTRREHQVCDKLDVLVFLLSFRLFPSTVTTSFSTRFDTLPPPIITSFGPRFDTSLVFLGVSVPNLLLQRFVFTVSSALHFTPSIDKTGTSNLRQAWRFGFSTHHDTFDLSLRLFASLHRSPPRLVLDSARHHTTP